jgi:hypothetical protein
MKEIRKIESYNFSSKQRKKENPRTWRGKGKAV